ncbi:unnamed protein product (macronuclear) [Paramecium tetraurelia]|uniref:Uncharacterized protein n=1 Tax=Paramecium tetraurelia TaxID=5888 RepID=A0EGF2_PARTE|nr:uncharacterized protein GSPATT00026717001 [Paramecium tetraurelia]CAK94393.1 unnamed protein product [Paramecium tetraurelia]|eukprot:XP_001461766.1 hypothetical protein (macronuclear) [Paramecium tetraurelia strain d4-2]
MFYKTVSDKKCTPSPLRKCSQYHIPNTYFSTLKQPLERTFEPIEKQKTLTDEQQEIQKLHQLIEQLKDENNKLRSALQQQQLQFQYETQQLNQQIANMQQEQQSLKQALIDRTYQNNKMIQYIEELSSQHKNLQFQYQDAYLLLQQAEIFSNQIMLLQKELKGKEDEIEILKNELLIPTKTNTEQSENQLIYDFLKNVKQQYTDDECRSLHLYE